MTASRNGQPTDRRRRFPSVGRCAGRAALSVIAAALIWLGAGAPSAPGYTFGSEGSYRGMFHDLDRPHHGVRPLVTWSPEVWPPGETLSFVLVDSPLWYPWFSDVGEVEAFFEEAMRYWSEIPTADIRWDIGSVDDSGNRESGWSVSKIMPFDESHGYDRSGSHAFTNAPRDDLILSCTVRMYRGSRVRPRTPERWLWTLRVAAHELGHCLYLSHPAPYPFFGDRRLFDSERSKYGFPPYWPHRPIMSAFNPAETGAERLTEDDRVGASLARPREGWLESTGAIWGNVLVEDGEPAVQVYVLANRLGEDGRVEASVGRFTDLSGTFVIGGLAPGEYALRVQAIRERVGLGRLVDYERITLDIRDTIRAAPVRVRAGERAGPLTIVVRRGQPWLAK